MTTGTAFTISHTIDQQILADINAEFDTFRRRIASVSIEAMGTITAMYSPLAPVDQSFQTNPVIDIDAIEWDQFQVELSPVIETEEAAHTLDFAIAAG